MISEDENEKLMANPAFEQDWTSAICHSNRPQHSIIQWYGKSFWPGWHFLWRINGNSVGELLLIYFQVTEWMAGWRYTPYPHYDRLMLAACHNIFWQEIIIIAANAILVCKGENSRFSLPWFLKKSLPTQINTSNQKVHYIVVFISQYFENILEVAFLQVQKKKLNLNLSNICFMTLFSLWLIAKSMLPYLITAQPNFRELELIWR